MKISASTNPPPIENMLSYIAEIAKLDIDFIHCDIMDGEFVQNKTFDYTVLNDIHLASKKPLDVHVMARRIEESYQNYIQNGVEILTIHFEAFNSIETLDTILKDIKSHGIKAGLAISPKTPFSSIIPLLDSIDLLLIMSVEPGKSGQEFIHSSLIKVREIVQYRKENGYQFLIEVDGGINNEVAPLLKAIGVDIIVLGGYLYSSSNKETAIKTIRS